mgnify:CR=1 FL=1
MSEQQPDINDVMLSERRASMEKQEEELRDIVLETLRAAQEKAASTSEEQPWRSKCCTRDGTEISRSFLTFTLTSTLSIIILVFALWQLAENEPSDSLNPLWISLVSSVSAIHVPSPLQQSDSSSSKKN